MPPFTQSQWSSFRDTLLLQLNSEYGKERIVLFVELPYFFEGWLEVECVRAASSSFGSSLKPVSINKEFQRIPKLDLGLEVDDNLCAAELKHIPTCSGDAKSRFLGPKGSNVVKDFLKLYNFGRRNHILCKLLILYGPAEFAHNQGASCERGRQGLDKICLKCAMNLFIEAAGGKSVNWQCHNLQTSGMYIVEVDI